MGFMDFLKKAGEQLTEHAQKQYDRQMREAAQRQNRTTPDYQPGHPGNKTTIVLSAPGSAEEKAGRPAAGQTGKNLNSILAEAHKKDSKRFPSPNKDDYQIVNATQNIHYKGKTGRTEATSPELNDPQNIQRINSKLKGAETVVALGQKAQEMVEKSDYHGTVIKGSHPSNQNINRNYGSDKATPGERAADRKQQMAADLLKQNKKP